MNFKIRIIPLFILGSISFHAQEIKIWSKILKSDIVICQKVNDDSIFLSIDRKDNKWLGKNVRIRTVNYWSHAPVEVTADCCRKKTLIIKRTFLGNNIVGDRLFFRKNNGKYYFNVLSEFEQKAEY
ncbi:hypothetical protein [Chryseobacterium sp. BIGb0232]|uniref:hypothetical protein n=1 Tax=Chryseobacterium sp. BIGb0232 TaxID=2940598 RepID=UPI000F48457C|nr:hypothetical protein [Chryseobacterium sp. BIGb0232]MCS4302470.1 hypothetical protein [Chryseobacterium sp. BIGb0232]ROS18412.1 hypothetical protein EDF65_2808 [Chryseobacterium nakagawai]